MLSIFQTSKAKKRSLTLTHPSPVEINEILLRIFSYLTQPILKSVAALISWRWYIVSRELALYEFHWDTGNPGTWKDLAKKISIATSLTLGKIPTPIWQRYDPVLSKEQWQKLMTLLNQVNTTSTAAGNKHSAAHRLRELTMYVESWWIDDIASQTIFNAVHLTCLTMYLSWFESGSDYLEWILDQCPNLSSLSLVSCHLRFPDSRQQRTMFKVTGKESKIRTGSWPLQSLSITGLRVSAVKLKDLVPGLGNLTKISLIFFQRGSISDEFQNQEAGQAFWQAMARHCSRLRAISVVTSDPSNCHLQVGLFPSVVEFGISSSCIATDNQTWQALSNVHRIENHLTALEIIGVERDVESFSAILHQFLCSSPHLLHFKAADTWVSQKILFDELTDDMPPCQWACRGLKTLSIDYRGKLLPNEWPSARTLFGYLGRVCPKLQDLSVGVRYGEPYLPLDLSLLTRLQDLRRLELRFKMWGVSHKSGCKTLQRPDFGWMRLNSPKPASRPAQDDVSHHRLSTIFHTLSTIREWKPDQDPSNCLQAARACTLTQDKNRVRFLKECCRPSFTTRHTKRRDWENLLNGRNDQRTTRHTKWNDWENLLNERNDQRLKMLQQQKENNYRTDYNGDTPMVDGLPDFEFLGSNLDVEACLQALVWRLQQQHKEEDRDGAGKIQSTTSTKTTTQLEHPGPWKHMEQLVFSVDFDKFIPKKVKVLQGHCRETCNGLSQVRSDIEFLCQIHCAGRAVNWK